MTDEPNKPAPPVLDPCTPENVKPYLSGYVKLKAKIKAMNDAHDERVQPHKDLLNALNVRLLEFLNNSNLDNVNVTDVGTFHKIHRKSASIQDGDAFRRHVIGHEAWELIDWKANSIAVDKFIEEHGAPPPGVKYTIAVSTGVRQS